MNSYLTEGVIRDLFCKNNTLKAVCLEGDDSYIKHCILNALSEEAYEKGLCSECFFSEYNCDILSAVYVKNKNLFVFDESVNSLKSSLPCGIVIIDTAKVYNYAECRAYIQPLFACRQKHIDEAKRLKALCADISDGISCACSAYIDKAKVLNYILRFASRYSLRQSGSSGADIKRQLSSAGAWGVHCFYENIIANSNYTVRICDSTKALSPLIICGFSKLFNECGIDTVTYYCSVGGKAEHLVIPQLKTAFFSDSIYHEYPLEADSKITLQRFLKKDIPVFIKNNICKKSEIYSELVDRMILLKLQVSTLSEKISDLYCENTDFNEFENLKEKVKGLL